MSVIKILNFPHCETLICRKMFLYRYLFVRTLISRNFLIQKFNCAKKEQFLPMKNPSCNSLPIHNTIFKNSKIQNFRKLDLDGFFRVLTNIFWWGCEIWKQNIPKSLNSNAYVDFLQKYNDSKFAQCDNFGILLSPEKFSVKMNFKNYKYLSF